MLNQKASSVGTVNNKNPNIPLSKYKPDFDFKKIKINDVGKYSITRPYEAKQIVYSITESVKNPLNSLIITDATAGVGGDTIHFSKYFLSVNAVDILEENTEILKHNCDLFDIKNVNIYNSNYLDVFKDIKQDIIYMDPPWGGISYKIKDIVDIKLDNLCILEIVEKIKHCANTIFIKLPLNANMAGLVIKNKYIIYNKKNQPSFFLIHM